MSTYLAKILGSLLVQIIYSFLSSFQLVRFTHAAEYTQNYYHTIVWYFFSNLDKVYKQAFKLYSEVGGAVEYGFIPILF